MKDKIFKITTLQLYPYKNKREVIIKLIYVIQNQTVYVVFILPLCCYIIIIPA